MSAAQVVAAVKALADWKGSSRAAIIKYFQAEHKMEKDEATAAVSEGVKAAVLGGELIQLKQSFFIKGLTFPKPADITLGVEELHAPKDPSSRPAAVGDVVDVAYVGKLAENGHVFETSTLVFVLGDGNVIKAWDEGIVGMREGQQRRLTCPPKLAYGKRGSPPEIGPDATLVFDITFRSFRTLAEVEGELEEEEEEDFEEEDPAEPSDDDEEKPKAKKQRKGDDEEDEDED